VGSPGDFTASTEVFIGNLQKWGVWDESKIKILKGWFINSLPPANIKKISFLRLDGDLYESTRDPLNILYSKVTKGGIVYVDDYGSFNGCKVAVEEFRAQHNITSPLYTQYTPEPNGNFEAVYWFVE